MNTSNKFEQQAAEALPPVVLRRVEPQSMPVQFAGEEPESDGGMHMLAYLFVALVLACAAIGIGFIAGRYFS